MSPFWYEIIVYLCETVISGSFLLNLLKPKNNVWVTLLLWCQIIMLVIIVTPAFSVLRLIVIAVVEFIYLCVMFEDKLKGKVSKYLLKQGLALLSSVTSYTLFTQITDQKVSIFRSCTSDNCTYCLLYLLILSVMTSIVYQLVKKQKRVEVPWVIGTQLVIGVGECTAVLAVADSSSGIINAASSGLIVIAAIFMIIANISIGSFASHLLKQEFKSRNIDFGKELSNMEYKYYEMSVENDKKIRAIKHDISNQIQTIYSLFKNGEGNKGFEMIEQLRNKYSDVDRILYCENPVINIILSNKKREAEEKGIETHIRVKESLKSIPITDYDLSTVICNLLDNAVEGCINSNQTNPRLVVELLCKNRYLVIRVLNSCKVTMNIENTDSIETTKTGSQNHGIGMSIVAGISKKYRGDYVVSAQNGIFTATVILSIK